MHRRLALPKQKEVAMKKLICLLLMTSHLLLAQNNVAFLHIKPGFPAPNPSPVAAFSECNFEMAGGMVIVKAMLNEQEGDFILDTGSPGIIVNGHNNNLGKTLGAGVNGALKVAEVEIDHFQWGIIHQENVRGYVLDVSHLETACGRKILGLIGFDVLKNYELFFDYPNKTVKLLRVDKTDFMNGLRPVQSIPFALYGHVPVIVAKIGGKMVRLGIDSGAEVNLLDKKFFKSLAGSFLSDVEEEFITGLDRTRQSVIAADVRYTSIKKDTLDEMRYIFTDLSFLREQFGGPIDGLLGFPFFKNQLISINYQKRRIYIWK
jgi:hypothetical protein